MPNLRVRKCAILLVFAALISYTSVFVPTSASLQTTRIQLSFSGDRVLRGDVLIVSGRLSTVSDDRPIPLVTVRLRYHRVGDVNFTREVSMITSNPGGLFEDRINTTFLLKIGTWVVNASFPSQMSYESSWTAEFFTVVVQPNLSLYLSAHKIVLGQSVTFNGLLFACIPCTNDQVNIIFTRPDNTSITIPLSVVASGGPYPGGYYQGILTPDVPGPWRVRAVWNGNNVTLPAYSQIDGFYVDPTPTSTGLLAAAFSVIVGAAIVVALLWRKRRTDKKK